MRIRIPIQVNTTRLKLIYYSTNNVEYCKVIKLYGIIIKKEVYYELLANRHWRWTGRYG